MFGTFDAGVSNILYGKSNVSTQQQSTTPQNQSAQALKSKMAGEQYVGARAGWANAGAAKAKIPSPPQIRVPVNYPGQKQSAGVPARKPVPSRAAPSAEVDANIQEAAARLESGRWPERNDSLQGTAQRRGSSPQFMSGADFAAFDSDSRVRAAVLGRYHAYNASQPQGAVLAPGDIQNGHAEAFPPTGIDGESSAEVQDDQVVYCSPKFSAWSDSTSGESAAPSRPKGMRGVSKFTELMSPVGSIKKARAPAVQPPTTEVQISAPTFLSRANAQAAPIPLVTREQAQTNKAKYGQTDMALEHLSKNGASGQMIEANKLAAGMDCLTLAEAHEARVKRAQAKNGDQVSKSVTGSALNRSGAQKRKGLDPKNAGGSYLNFLGRSKSGASKSKQREAPAAPVVIRIPDAAPRQRQVVGRASQMTVFGDFIDAAAEEQTAPALVPAPLRVHKAKAPTVEQSCHAGTYKRPGSPTEGHKAAEARALQSSARQQGTRAPLISLGQVSAAPARQQQALEIPSTVREEASATSFQNVPSFPRTFNREDSMASSLRTSPDKAAQDVPARKQVDVNAPLPPRPTSMTSDLECAGPTPFRTTALDVYLNTPDAEHASRAEVYEASHRAFGKDEVAPRSADSGRELIVDTFVHQSHTTWRVQERRQCDKGLDEL